MAHELSWPAANLPRCGWPHSPFPDGVRLTPEQAEPRASLRYTNPHRRAPGFRLAKALAMIIMHDLYAYAPATPQQFVQWIGAPPGWAAEQFKLHSRRPTKINFNERIGEILEGRPRLSVGTVTAGGHA